MKLMGFGTRLLISAGDVEFSVIHTPGHTPGSMSMYGELDGSKVLFAGDINGALRKERGSDIESWKKTLYKLLELDIDKIYAGHEIAAQNPKEWLKKLSEKRE